MNIIEENYDWAWGPTLRTSTTHLILHHAAANGLSAQQIHAMHRGRGWRGIAYHYYVRKDGSVYRGREEKTVGGHTSGWNACSIGICFEGNFETDVMPSEQIAAGVELIAGIKRRYLNLTTIIGHRDVNATACPGRNFPMAIMQAATLPAKEEENEMRYHSVDDLPDWAKPTINKLIRRGALKGTEDGLDLSVDMVRMFVINDRLGVYG